MSECGCKVKAHRQAGEVEITTQIAYCPKHQEVDRLLKAAKRFIGWLDHTGMTCVTVEPTRVKAMREAITAAEGKP